MPIVRLIRFEELDDLLELYKHLNSNDPAINADEIRNGLWREIFDDRNLFYIVAAEDQKLVSSCTLAIVKNLTRGARPYGMVENVVTHPNYRQRGFGTAVLDKAEEIAKEKNCYKLMLMTSRKEESTLRFYEKAGFDRGTKTGFVKYFWA